MSFLAWILLGLLAGFVGSRFVNQAGFEIILDIALGIIGAMAGGILFNLVGARGLADFNLGSLLVATAGSVCLIVAYHEVRRVRWAHR